MAGWAAFRQGDLARAATLWTANRDRGSLTRAIAQMPADRADDTLALYRALDRLDPKGTAANFARFLAQQGAVEQALARLDALVRTYPTALERPAWLQAGAEILARAQRWEEAAAAYMRWAAEPGQAGIAWSGLGQMYNNRGDTAAAQSAFAEAIARDPAFADAYAALAATLVRTAAYAEADRWFAAALARKPERGDWLTARSARARAAGGDPTGALALYATATTRFPADAALQFEAAQFYRKAARKCVATLGKRVTVQPQRKVMLDSWPASATFWRDTRVIVASPAATLRTGGSNRCDVRFVRQYD